MNGYRTAAEEVFATLEESHYAKEQCDVKIGFKVNPMILLFTARRDYAPAGGFAFVASKSSYAFIGPFFRKIPVFGLIPGA